MLIPRFLLLAAALLASPAHALTAAEARGIAAGETDARIEVLNKAVESADDKTAAYIQALIDEAVKLSGDKVFIVRDGKGSDPVTGAAVDVPADAEDVSSNNRMRGELDSAMAALKLFSKDEKLRRQAVKQMQGETDESKLPLIEKAYAAETNAEIKSRLGLVRAAVLLSSSDQAKRLEAARLLAGSGDPSTKTVLLERLKSETCLLYTSDAADE